MVNAETKTAKEFDIIQQHFSNITFDSSGSTEIGIGDDAAVLSLSQLQQDSSKLLVSADMLCEGTHFLSTTDPSTLGYKSLAVNISDILAMGGDPKLFTLCISLPEPNNLWLEAFAHGLTQAAKQYGLSLIGGDTTRGPLSISIQIFGTTDKPILRSGAQVGDLVVVTGTLGDAAGGLDFILDPALAANFADDFQIHVQYLQDRHECPTPRAGLTQGFDVHAAIDISDGLIPDLTHICNASGVAAELNVDVLPISGSLLGANDHAVAKALVGGEDYELCLAIPPSIWPELQARAKELGILITHVGDIIPSTDRTVTVRGWSEQKLDDVINQGFVHFK